MYILLYKKGCKSCIHRKLGRIKNNRIGQSNNFTKKVERFYSFFADSRKTREKFEIEWRSKE